MLSRVCCAVLAALSPAAMFAQSLATPWSGYGHDAQHTAVSANAAQPLNSIRWQTPVDLSPQFTGNDILIHYGSIMVTPANSVIVPVKLLSSVSGVALKFWVELPFPIVMG